MGAGRSASRALAWASLPLLGPPAGTLCGDTLCSRGPLSLVGPYKLLVSGLSLATVGRRADAFLRKGKYRWHQEGTFSWGLRSTEVEVQGSPVY